MDQTSWLVTGILWKINLYGDVPGTEDEDGWNVPDGLGQPGGAQPHSGTMIGRMGTLIGHRSREIYVLQGTFVVYHPNTMSKSQTRPQSRFQARISLRSDTITHPVHISEGQRHPIAPCRSGSVPWKTGDFGPLSDIQTAQSVDPGQTKHQSSGYYICINSLQRRKTNGAILGKLLDEQSRFSAFFTHWPPGKYTTFTNRPNQSKDAVGNRMGHPSD